MAYDRKRKKRIKSSPLKSKTTPIVGIGASAGGIEAIIKLLTNLPDDTGFAFVIIIHLDAKSKSNLVEILTKSTSMQVVEVGNNMMIKPNCIYTIPPKFDVKVSADKFKINLRKKNILHMPIDIFFTSLAEHKKDKSIGVILSGTGSDGTIGLQAIRTEGGITFAQNPASAKYDTMPNNAIRSGAVDTILLPKEIAKELARIATHPYIKPSYIAVSSAESFKTEQFDELPQSMNQELSTIINKLRKITHFDFANYKSGTIGRRIKRRMVLHKISSLKTYSAYVSKHDDEAKALADDFLITITRFFRDNEVFDVLKKRIFPNLLKIHNKDIPLRIWIPGCSSGEEAYSLAILLTEILDKKGFQVPIRIFATDISENALQRARTGFFPEGIVRDVSKERLKRFFTKVEGGYCIAKFLREQCIFSRHDLIRDPPFAKIDFLSCRNLLIYFNPDLQKQVIPILHYALNKKGMLLLGRSEAPAGFPNLFTIIDKKYRVYLKKETVERVTPSFHTYISSSIPLKSFNRDTTFTDSNQFAQKETDRLLLDRYAPPCVLINEHLDIILTRGKISPYLSLSTGQPRLNIMKMATMELAMAIRHAIEAVKRSKIIMQKKTIELRTTEQPRIITFKIEVLKTFLKTIEQYYLIEFEETNRQSKKERSGKNAYTFLRLSKKIRNEDTQKFLVEQHYQSLMEQFEAAQEETITSNEELQSTNEELQSTNEELETAKEELQSSNEELSTVNEELHLRNVEITLINKDLNNLLTNIAIPIVLVDESKCIRNYTPSSSKILKLILSDIGRPLGDIKPRIKGINLDNLLSEVLSQAIEKVIEIRDDENRWHKLIIKPYQNFQNKVEGAVILLIDIDDLKRATEGIKKSYEDAQIVIENLPTAILLIDYNLNVLLANEAFDTTFKTISEKVTGKNFSKIGNGEWNIPELIHLIQSTITKNISFRDFEVEATFPNVGRKIMLLNASQINLAGAKKKAALLAIQDITQRREREYKKFYTRLSLTLEAGKIGTWEFNSEQNLFKWDKRMFEIYHLESTHTKISLQKWLSMVHPIDKPRIERAINIFLATKKILDIEYRITLIPEKTHWLHTRAIFEEDSNEKKTNVAIGTTLDITEEKTLTQALTAEKKKLLQILHQRDEANHELESFAYVASHDLKAPLRGIESLTTWIEKDNKNKLTEDSKENLSLLRKRVNRMSNLINGILLYSRAGRIDLNLKRVSVRKLLDELIEDLAPPKRFQFKYLNKFPTFKTALFPLKQIFSNLISNAIKHNSRKNGIITIGVISNKECYEFFITDNGSGIAPQYHEIIFQPFQTLEPKDSVESTGIGLSIVKKIVELYHGTITVESDLNKDTTFRFTWPKKIENGMEK